MKRLHLLTHLLTLPARLAIGLVRAYQRWISPWLAPRCCYYPTCSQYAIEAMKKHGLLCGGWLALKRISRCHPAATPGEDPVPDCGCRCRHKRRS
ncbi:MAG TPA: membrane protein insertion efficiency factor YidD [Piscirickettsiaceae bacterium]|nr:membrane protein insertion efficiency factor YidD [Piscirickettsiaceae bacterium]HIQ40606.1 membrane protein insertion efficiency factor YidD [Sulfurivirga caldicuralii]